MALASIPDVQQGLKTVLEIRLKMGIKLEVPNSRGSIYQPT